MNANEATNVLEVLTAAWPWADWPDDTVELWIAASADLDYEIAKEAAADAVKQLERPPTIAWFRGTVRALEARRQVRPALPPPPTDPDAWRAGLASAREALHRHDPGEPAA